MSSQIDLSRFALLLRAKRGGWGLRETAEEIDDVSASTISRIEGERVKDMTSSTCLRVCDWLEVNPAELILNASSTPTAELPEAEALELQVLRSKELPPQTANILAAMIRAAYGKEQRRRGGGDGC